ncbi:uncharacterized protein ColSpa_05393 [Colletotrichum spaethianum]|uniref:Uncharacterized protein n=1 Tax=Colletotrichum spaethianum TaxID=700344 RepID=A0AA37LB40_9PEZI|nr:uncharacterized protein ColSpa_05393 [Colletotrichum spaethianum]GKT45212.1 hypothetical protein ColSpa_05393 [Colletotrichum spaethianum]
MPNRLEVAGPVLIQSSTHDSIDIEDLADLHLKHAALNGRIDDEAHKVSLFDLANTEDTGKGLLLDRMVPPELDKDDSVSPREVETLPSGAQRNNQDLDLFSVLKLVDGLVALLSVLLAAEVGKADAFRLQYATDDLHDDVELTED